MKQNKSKKQENELPFLNSLDLVYAFAWSKLQEENDVNWLREGYDGRQKKIKSNELNEIRKKLEDEAFLLMDDDNFNSILHKRMLIYDYESKYNTVIFVLQRMWMGYGDNQMESRLKHIKLLNKLDFKMPELNSVLGDKKELERLFQQAEGIKTKIKLLSDDIQSEGSKVTRSLNKDCIAVGKIIECGYIINPKEISQAYWIDLQKTAQEIIRKPKPTE